MKSGHRIYSWSLTEVPKQRRGLEGQFPKPALDVPQAMRAAREPPLRARRRRPKPQNRRLLGQPEACRLGFLAFRQRGWEKGPGLGGSRDKWQVAGGYHLGQPDGFRACRGWALTTGTELKIILFSGSLQTWAQTQKSLEPWISAEVGSGMTGRVWRHVHLCVRMYVYVCTYVHVYVSISAYVCACVHGSAYVCACVCIW